MIDNDLAAFVQPTSKEDSQKSCPLSLIIKFTLQYLNLSTLNSRLFFSIGDINGEF